MRFYAGRKVLVPGGAGFIGSHLVSRLLTLGADVSVFDDFSTGCIGNLTAFGDDDRFNLVEWDITRPIVGSYDLVFNLACPASPQHYRTDPIKTWRSSVLGVNNLLELCQLSGARFVQASTSEVYGNPLVHPQTEDYWGNANPNGPRACYDEGKRAAEALTVDFHRHRGVDVRIARIFNTYGPNMSPEDGRVVSNFVVQALQGRNLTIYGDGRQTRSFCFVSDLVEGLLRLGATPGANGHVVNLGNPQEISMIDLAGRVLDCTGSNSALVHQGLPQDDPERRLPDISLAQALLGWSPVIGLDAGLKETVGYFRTMLKTAALPLDAQSMRA